METIIVRRFFVLTTIPCDIDLLFQDIYANIGNNWVQADWIESIKTYTNTPTFSVKTWKSFLYDYCNYKKYLRCLNYSAIENLFTYAYRGSSALQSVPTNVDPYIIS